MRYSRPYKRGNRLFRYDHEKAVVQWVSKATDDERMENETWQMKYGEPLWSIDRHGMIVHHTVGLARENWKNKAVRDEYLDIWNDEIDYECQMIAEQEFGPFDLLDVI